MADRINPHHLVALMRYIFWKKQNGSSRSWDSTSINPEYGITNKRETSIRTFPVLDAIASISVFKNNSQVAAVALQLNSKEQKLRLTIAENGDVSPYMVVHLKSVWQKLQALSNQFAAERGSDDDEQGSPDIPEDVALQLRVNIFREIYQFSLEKQMQRVEKWWSGVLDFVKELSKRRRNDLQGFESDLLDVAAGLCSIIELSKTLRHNPERGLTHNEWKSIYAYSMWTNEKAALVLQVGERKIFRCERLAEELNDSPSSRPENAFRLRRALEKLTSLTRHIECLISFANSPRLRPALQYNMTITTVPGQTRTVEFPRSSEQWQSVLEAAAAKKFDWQEDYAGNLVKHFKTSYDCPVHCECALVQFLMTRHNDSWDKVPAFSYIGVSKLSCSACRTWLEAFNQVGPREFFTRGSHGKWYFPWGIPQTEESLQEAMSSDSSEGVELKKSLVKEAYSGDVMVQESLGKVAPKKSLEQTIAEMISRRYIKYLKDEKLYRSGSDSIDASLSGGKRHLSNAMMEDVCSRLDAVKNKLLGI